MKKQTITASIAVIFIAAAAAIFIFISGDPPTIQPKRFGTALYESARDIIKTDDGYLLAGMSSSSSDNYIDAYLLKLDKKGNKTWENSFGGKMDDRLFSVVQNEQGGYTACGYSSSFGANGEDFYLVCTDKKGNLIYQKTYGTPQNDEAYSLLQLADGGYIMAGNTVPDPKKSGQAVYIVKTDADGAVIWENEIRAKKSITANCIIKSGDGGYILAGTTDSYGAGMQDAAMIKVDAKGNTIWIKTFGGKSSDTGSRVVAADNGGFVLIGSTSIGNQSTDIYLVRTDKDGGILWSQTYGGPGIDQGIAVINSGDGGFFLGANSESFSAGSSDIFILKVDAKGKLEWSHNYGGTKDDYIGNLLITKDRGLAVAGWSGRGEQGDYDAYFFKSNLKGLF